jgi:hypothetical protein
LLETAKVLGLTVPAVVLTRADEVIELVGIGVYAAGNASITGRGTGRYIRFDSWSWLSLHCAQASGVDHRRACPATDDIPALA